jgi:hypothetical protein
MAKISSYQKLKAENLKLKQDIYVLLRLENSERPEDMIKYFGVKVNWDMLFKLEDQVWNGSSSFKNPL